MKRSTIILTCLVALVLIAGFIGSRFYEVGGRGIKQHPAENNIPEAKKSTNPQDVEALKQMLLSNSTGTNSKVSQVNKAQVKETNDTPLQVTSAPVTTESIENSAARAALALVGLDEEAEKFWIDAINDPELSANERRELIEDLNEEGFQDPNHPTESELPLIIRRMEIIEDLAAEPMDEVNAEAFQEAYKDLSAMYDRLTSN